MTTRIVSVVASLIVAASALLTSAPASALEPIPGLAPRRFDVLSQAVVPAANDRQLALTTTQPTPRIVEPAIIVLPAGGSKYTFQGVGFTPNSYGSVDWLLQPVIGAAWSVETDGQGAFTKTVPVDTSQCIFPRKVVFVARDFSSGKDSNEVEMPCTRLPY
jgi:hypothetical protein